MRAGFRVDELGVDAHPVLVALHRAFEHIAHAELLADRLGVDALALVGEGGVAGDDEAVADARQVGRQVLGDAVGEIVLRRIAGEVRERQHDHREMLGLGRSGGVRGDGRRRVCRDGGRSAGDQPMPGASRAGDCEQRRGRPTRGARPHVCLSLSILARALAGWRRRLRRDTRAPAARCSSGASRRDRRSPHRSCRAHDRRPEPEISTPPGSQCPPAAPRY